MKFTKKNSTVIFAKVARTLQFSKLQSSPTFSTIYKYLYSVKSSWDYLTELIDVSHFYHTNTKNALRVHYQIISLSNSYPYNQTNNSHFYSFIFFDMHIFLFNLLFINHYKNIIKKISKNMMKFGFLKPRYRAFRMFGHEHKGRIR